MLFGDENLHTRDLSSGYQTTNRAKSNTDSIYEDNYSIASSLSEIILVYCNHDATIDRQANMEVSEDLGRIYQMLSDFEIRFAPDSFATSVGSTQRGFQPSSGLERSCL